MAETKTREDFDWGYVRRLVPKAIIGAVLASAVIAIFGVLVGEFNVVHYQLFLTIIVMLSFVLMAWYDADVSAKRSSTFATVSILVSFYLLIVGFVKIWFPSTVEQLQNGYEWYDVSSNFATWLWLVFVARLALLHAHVLLNIQRRFTTPILQMVAKVTFGLIALLAILISIPSLFLEIDYSDTYWRLLWIVAILDVAGTVLIPLTHQLFYADRTSGRGSGGHMAQTVTTSNVPFIPAPTSQTAPVVPVASPPAPATKTQVNPAELAYAPLNDAPPKRLLAWPRYSDGTPLPAKADGTPDFSGVI